MKHVWTDNGIEEYIEYWLEEQIKEHRCWSGGKINQISQKTFQPHISKIN